MALHSQLFPRLVGAIRGEVVTPLNIEGGSVNYRLMDDTTAYIVDPSRTNQSKLIAHFENMRRTGHMSLTGPHGVACEQGAPGMHWTYNIGSVLGVVRWAHANDHKELQGWAIQCLFDELDLDTKFMWRGESIFPAPRVKDEAESKNRNPQDDYRDVFIRLATGDKSKVKKPAKYWAHPQAIAVATMRMLLRTRVWGKAQIERAKHAYNMPLPRLYLPILKHGLPEGGYVAWIEKTEESVRALGKDACNWVRCSTDGVTIGYDFESEPPTS